jgi:hypothetical protein
VQIDAKTEYEYVTQPLLKRLNSSLPRVLVTLDKDGASENRSFEEFEVWFAIPPSIEDELSVFNIDSFCLIKSIVDEALEMIQRRFEELAPGFDGAIEGVGLLSETEWLFDDEIPAHLTEVMLGDLWEAGSGVGLFCFQARFIAPVDQLESRCLQSPPIEVNSDRDPRWRTGSQNKGKVWPKPPDPEEYNPYRQ